MHAHTLYDNIFMSIFIAYICTYILVCVTYISSYGHTYLQFVCLMCELYGHDI